MSLSKRDPFDFMGRNKPEDTAIDAEHPRPQHPAAIQRKVAEGRAKVTVNALLSGPSYEALQRQVAKETVAAGGRVFPSDVAARWLRDLISTGVDAAASRHQIDEAAMTNRISFGLPADLHEWLVTEAMQRRLSGEACPTVRQLLELAVVVHTGNGDVNGNE